MSPWWQYGKPKCWPACVTRLSSSARQVVAEHVAAVVGEPERLVDRAPVEADRCCAPRGRRSRGRCRRRFMRRMTAVALARLADVARRTHRHVEHAVGAEADELPAVVASRTGSRSVTTHRRRRLRQAVVDARRSAGSSRPRRRRDCRRARPRPTASPGRWRRVCTGAGLAALDLDRVDLAGAAAADVDARSCRRRCGRAPSRARSAPRRSRARCESPPAARSLSSGRAACAGAATPAPARAPAARSGAAASPCRSVAGPGRVRTTGHRSEPTDRNPRGYQRRRDSASMSPAASPTLPPAATISSQVTLSTGTPFGEPRRLGRPLRLARRQHALHPGSGRRGGAPGDERLHLLRQIGGGAEPAGVDDDREHAVENPAPAVGHRAGGGAAGERAAEQLADQRQAGALVLAERQQRAERLDHGVARVRRRLAAVVDDRARLDARRPC